MTLIDMLHESYIKIYNAIKTYDYSIDQYTELIQTMISLRRVIFSLNNLNPRERISQKDERIIEEESKFDFCRAFRCEEYC